MLRTFVPRRPGATVKVADLYSQGSVGKPPIYSLDQEGITENPFDQGEESRVASVDNSNPNTSQTNRLYTPPTTRHEYRHITNGTNDNFQLGITARSVMISNWTPQFAWIETLDTYVPPFCIGMVLQVPSGTQNSKVTWEAPPGVTQPAANTATQLNMIWMKDMMLPNSGLLMKLPVLP